MAPNKTSEHLAQNHQLSERKMFPKRAINEINLKKLSQDHHMLDRQNNRNRTDMEICHEYISISQNNNRNTSRGHREVFNMWNPHPAASSEWYRQKE
jgi:hypothetical protein